MIERISKLIKELPEISDYKVLESKSTTYELFYVLKELETSRASDSTTYSLTIYVDEDNKRGSTNVAVHSYDSDEEIIETLKDGIVNAKQAMNEHYELVEPEEFKNEDVKEMDYPALSKQIVDAVFAADHFKEGWINSTEIFITEKRNHFVNSKGCDYSYNHFEVELSIIPTWQASEEEVELLKVIRTPVVDPAMITEQVQNALEDVKYRSSATKLLNKDIPVILQKEDVARVFGSFVRELDYTQFYTHTNLYELGKSIQEGATGDLITLDLVDSLPNSITSSPIDVDGMILSKVNVIQDGMITSLWGSQQYGTYLKVKPTGVYNNYKVQCGHTSYQEMTQEPVLVCISFSGLQIERYSGYIGGEVRLGYYIEGNTITPVTGLSISGNLNEMKKDLQLSSDEYSTNRYEGPKYIKFKGFKIN